MHPPEVKAEAMALIERGINDCEISRRLGIPRGTIRDWRRPTYQPREDYEICPRCWLRAKPIRLAPADYAELLGTYLGDGSISRGARTFRLRITLDAKYPVIISDTSHLLERAFPRNRVGLVEREGCVDVSVYCLHLPCLFPQHALGRKHERKIRLEPWQQQIVDAAPWPFIRGCVRTDGCVFINRTDVHRSEPYEYLSYEFSNSSADIVEIFVEACRRVGVVTRSNRARTGNWRVRIYQRESVALMQRHVGLKA